MVQNLEFRCSIQKNFIGYVHMYDQKVIKILLLLNWGLIEILSTIFVQFGRLWWL